MRHLGRQVGVNLPTQTVDKAYVGQLGKVNLFKDLGASLWRRFALRAFAWAEKWQLPEAVFCLAFAVLFSALLTRSDASLDIDVLNEGDIAQRTVRVPHVLELVSQAELEAARTSAIERVPAVFDFDSEAMSAWVSVWRQSVSRLAQAGLAPKRELMATLEKSLGVSVSQEELNVLLKLKGDRDLDASFAFALAPLWEQKIIDPLQLGSRSAELVNIRDNTTLVLDEKALKSFLTIEEARDLVRNASRLRARAASDRLKYPWTRWSNEQREVVFRIQARLVGPNVTLNKKESEARRDAALRAFVPPKIRLERGEVLVREGERVSKRASELSIQLARLSEDSKGSWALGGTQMGMVLFVALGLYLLRLFGISQFPSVLARRRDVLVFLGGLILGLAFFKLSAHFALRILADEFREVPQEFFLLLIPLATPAMALRLLLGRNVAVAGAAIFSIAAAALLESSGTFGLYIFLVSLCAIHFLQRCRTRGELYHAGFRSSAIAGLGALALHGVWGGVLPEPLRLLFSLETGQTGGWTLGLWIFLGGAGGALASAALTLVVVPLIESVLGYTSDLKLLELARMDHPLLRELILKAPGTYHHSIVVGSLSEAGCEAVGARALLTRVGAYYHDIGKIHRPEYFVENQSGGVNPHELTRPALSAKIIISHVKEGRILAERFKLGSEIIDFIMQHHGTQLVSYFFRKAQAEAQAAGAGDLVNEEDFRYPGPKPQNKETAILALADGVEAATRSLVEPTPARLEGMVKKIVGRALEEGLLDEADITLAEVHSVQKAFLRILLAIHHSRIQYPDQEEGLPKPSTLSFIKAKNT